MNDKTVRKRIDIVSLKLVRESSILYPARQVDSPAVAADLFRRFIGDSDREVFVVCAVDTKNQPTSIHVASVGTLSSSLVHPREVYKAAILSNSAAVIVGHNHPSGDCTESKEDVHVTRRLLEAGKVLGIELLDHIIIGGEKHVSLREKGVV